MQKTKIAITLDAEVLSRVDGLIAARAYPNRSRAIQSAVVEKLDRIDRTRLARECAKLNPKEERAMAEEGMRGDAREWPEY